jgi:endonuclease VIII
MVTAAGARDVRVGVDRLTGTTVSGVEAKGKHLLIGFRPAEGDELVLHTHLGMKGSWRVRAAGRPWGRVPGQPLVVVEAGDHHAACWSPVLLRLMPRHSLGLGVLSSLGPDLLVEPLDMDDVMSRVRRARTTRPVTTVGELLLEQSVAAGIGNVYRCEVLFIGRVSPFRSLSDADDEVIEDLFRWCAAMLRANVGRGGRRDTGGGPGQQWVHRRAGLPCRRCGTLIRSMDLGRTPRRVYWCPTCQPDE